MAIKRGNRYFRSGSTRVASFSFGHHPEEMNNAVINPQAINAPMLGITIRLNAFPKS
jgi:hypothetical protein